MRCTVLAIGSRGDVSPLVALGKGLAQAGFSVRCATHGDFEPLVRRHGLEFFPLTGDAASFFSGPASIALRERMRKPREYVRFSDQYLATFLERLLDGAWEASEDADVILCWPWTRFGPSLAEKLGVPVFIASPNPVLHLPTRSFANPFQGPVDFTLGPLYNRMSWRWALPCTRVGQAQVDRWRTKLGLPTMTWEDELRRVRRLPHLLGFSPVLLPKPRDWADWVHVTGYWLLDDGVDHEPPAELEKFLVSGDPPVAIGFSSQIGRNAAGLSRTVVEALASSGRRGVFIAGFGGLKGVELPDSVFQVPSAPYDWLFPRIAAMVHHGGSGSVGAAARAGVPSFAVPFGYEQGLWGRRIADLGIGVPPVFAEKVTVRRLASAIRKVTDDETIRARAHQVADLLRAEDGVADAVSIIERSLASTPRS